VVGDLFTNSYMQTGTVKIVQSMLGCVRVCYTLVKRLRKEAEQARTRPQQNVCVCVCRCSPQGLGGHLVEVIALLLLPVAIAMCGYAIFIFVWRSQMIAKKRVRHT